MNQELENLIKKAKREFREFKDKKDTNLWEYHVDILEKYMRKVVSLTLEK